MIMSGVTRSSSLVCDVGYYCLNGARLPCLAGSYSNTTMSTSCINCQIGYIQSYTNATLCEPCVAGRYAINNINCVDCQPGIILYYIILCIDML